jgi:drug/metabolite transporter (DMT)-like permease
VVTLLLVQAGVVVAGGFVVWLWLFSVCPAGVVAGVSVLSPIFAIFLGHFVFGEPLSPVLLAAAAPVSCGIMLINRRASARG